ncbi:MAG: DoxX family protein [Flavobacteriales bacterium]
MKYLIYIARIIVGSVFVVSGLIKANDTLGFSYKLEEYFMPNSLGGFWTMFEDFALPIAILVCVAEVVLGLSLLFGTKYKLTVILITAFLVFFGFLTYYTAECNPYEIVTYVNEAGETITTNRECVLDCGCFGDALKGSLGRSLTPWESFQKDMVLLFFTIFLFFGWKSQKVNNESRDKLILVGSLLFTVFFSGYVFGWWMPLSFIAIASSLYIIIKWFYVRKGRDWVIIGMLVGISSAFIWYTLTYLPVKDYRPYAEGNNLPELMKSSDDFKQEIMDYETKKLLAEYSTMMEKDLMVSLAADSAYNDTSATEEQKSVIKVSMQEQIGYKYEDLVYAKADSLATDSMEKANLLPPVYASMFYMQNKETGERESFSSTAYSKDKLWEKWDFVYVLVNNETGAREEVEKKDYNEEEWTAKGFEKQNPPTFLEKDGYDPKIPLDFDFNDDSINQDVLHSENYTLLVISWDMEMTNKKAIDKLKVLHSHSIEKGYNFHAATSRNYLVEEFTKKFDVPFPFASADEKILKTIVRSNPGLVLLKGGIVIKKWDQHRMPKPKKLEKIISKHN